MGVCNYDISKREALLGIDIDTLLLWQVQKIRAEKKRNNGR